MATAAMAYGERRFGAAYTVRIVLALVLVGVLVGLWSGRTNPGAPSHPALLWISIALVAAFAALWIVLGKTVLIINDAGVRRESFLGQQELAWSQIAETRSMAPIEDGDAPRVVADRETGSVRRHPRMASGGASRADVGPWRLRRPSAAR